MGNCLWQFGGLEE